MAIPTNKQELLAAIASHYRKLEQELASVPSEHAHEATLEGHAKGTRMSVADLVAYLIGWNLLVLKWCDDREKGITVDFPETGYQWNELGRLAQKFYADLAGIPYAERLQQLGAVYQRILTLVGRLGNDALYGEPWYKDYTQGRMIQLNTSSPYANARSRLRRWKKANGLP